LGWLSFSCGGGGHATGRVSGGWTKDLAGSKMAIAIKICRYAAISEGDVMGPIDETVRVLQALGQDTRFKIFKVLCGRTFCVCELEEIFGITQPAISHHLATLKDAGLVNDSREGQWVFYEANAERLRECWRALEGILNAPIDETPGMEALADKVREIETNPKAPRRCK